MPTGVYVRTPKPLPDALPRFWRYVDRRNEAGCWLWTGALTTQGYGVFWADRKVIPAHRWIYMHTHGTLTIEQHVCHTCDNPRCVRLDHLFLGNALINVRDAINKGRFDPNRVARLPRMRGEANGNSVLTEAQVREIRAIYKPAITTHKSPVSWRNLAKKYGVSKFAIQYALKKGWRHLLDVESV